jgi:hypothetical protein
MPGTPPSSGAHFGTSMPSGGVHPIIKSRMVTATCSMPPLAHCGLRSDMVLGISKSACLSVAQCRAGTVRPSPARRSVIAAHTWRRRLRVASRPCRALPRPNWPTIRIPDRPGFQGFRFGCSLIAVIDAHRFRARMVWISVVLPIYAALSWRCWGTCSPFSISISLSRRRITSTEPLRPIRTTAGRKLMNCMDCVRL